jgi:anti-anti-sigma factor
MPQAHLSIERTQVDRYVVLKVSGRMDAENALEFEDACNKCMAEGHNALLVDLSGLAYVSSMGLRSFLSIAKALQAKGGILKLASMKGLVKQVFEITGLMQAFSVFESLDSAIQ